MRTLYSIPEITMIVTPLAKQYGADRIFLFGSYARGEANEQSDIDLRIDKGDIRGLQFAGLLGDLEDQFGKNIDLISSAAMNDAFLKQIEPEEVLIYERESA